MKPNRRRRPVKATGLFGRPRTPKPFDVDQVLYGIRIVGTTWLTRGRAYWTRRVLYWIGMLLVAAIGVTMAVGVVVGCLSDTHDALARGVIIGVFSVGNVAAFVGLLVLGWPTDARCRKNYSAGVDRDMSGGRGATIAMVLLGNRALATLVLPVLLVFAAGAMLAVLVFVSLPQLPEEKMKALFLQDAHDKYSKGHPSKPHRDRRAKRHR
jgi:hypothetical protein